MKLTMCVPDALHAEIKKAAQEENVSMSELVRRALRDHLQNLRRKRAAARIRGYIGKVFVAEDALEELEAGREDDLKRYWVHPIP